MLVGGETGAEEGNGLLVGTEEGVEEGEPDGQADTILAYGLQTPRLPILVFRKRRL